MLGTPTVKRVERLIFLMILMFSTVRTEEGTMLEVRIMQRLGLPGVHTIVEYSKLSHYYIPAG
jgi:hypothetical protein